MYKLHKLPQLSLTQNFKLQPSTTTTAVLLLHLFLCVCVWCVSVDAGEPSSLVREPSVCRRLHSNPQSVTTSFLCCGASGASKSSKGTRSKPSGRPSTPPGGYGAHHDPQYLQPGTTPSRTPPSVVQQQTLAGSSSESARSFVDQGRPVEEEAPQRYSGRARGAHRKRGQATTVTANNSHLGDDDLSDTSSDGLPANDYDSDEHHHHHHHHHHTSKHTPSAARPSPATTSTGVSPRDIQHSPVRVPFRGGATASASASASATTTTSATHTVHVVAVPVPQRSEADRASPTPYNTSQSQPLR